MNFTEEPTNYTQAIFWTRKAARQGFALAEWNMGIAYQRGQGVPQNSGRAIYWRGLAEEQGCCSNDVTSGTYP